MVLSTVKPNPSMNTKNVKVKFHEHADFFLDAEHS